MKNKTEFRSDWGRVPFANGHMIGQPSSASYFREVSQGITDIKETDLRILWKDPYEFEATLQIVSISPPILQSMEGGTRYQTNLSELQRLVELVGIAQGGMVTGKWTLTKKSRSTPWYLSLKMEEEDDDVRWSSIADSTKHNRKHYESEFGVVTFVEKEMAPNMTHRRLCDMFDAGLATRLALMGVCEEERSSRKMTSRRRWGWRRRAEYYAEEAIELNLSLEMSSPFEFEDTLKIQIGNPTIFESLTDGYKYSGRLAGLLKVITENGIPKGGAITGRWRISRDSWQTLWYLEYLGST